MPEADTGTMSTWSNIQAIGGQLFEGDFWTRMVRDPLGGVQADPWFAVKSGVAAGGAVLAGGLALKAGIVAGIGKALSAVGGVLGGVLKAPAAVKTAAGPVSWIVRHPIISYLAVTNAELPTEIVKAVAVVAARPAAPAPVAPVVRPPPLLPAPLPPSAPVVPAAARAPSAARARPAPGDPWAAMFAW